VFPAAYSRLIVLNVRELRTHWGRALASVAVVAVSAALLVAVLGVSGSITGSINRLASSIGGDANLEVSGITDDGFDDALFPIVAGVQNVTAAVPLIRAPVTVKSDRNLLLGVGQNAAALHSDLETAIRDQYQEGEPGTPAPNGVVVGYGVGVTKGEQFDLGSTRATAVEVLKGPAAHRLNDGHFVVAPLALAQQVTGRDLRAGRRVRVWLLCRRRVLRSRLHGWLRVVRAAAHGRHLHTRPHGHGSQRGVPGRQRRERGLLAGRLRRHRRHQLPQGRDVAVPRRLVRRGRCRQPGDLPVERRLPHDQPDFVRRLHLRRDRVEMIAARAARINHAKAPGPVAKVFMRALMPIMFSPAVVERTAGKSQRYRIDFDERVPAGSAA